MDLPSTEDLIKRIVTKNEIQELALMTLTEKVLKELGTKAKIIDYRKAIIKRANKNKKIHKKLELFLYEHVEITATQTQYLLGINTRLRNKLIESNILVPTSFQKNKYRNGTVKYFSYSSIIKCFNSATFKSEKKVYDASHDENQRRAKKAVTTKQNNTLEKIRKLEVKVKQVKPTSLYKSALKSKEKYSQELEQERSLYGHYSIEGPSFYNDLDKAPVEDRNRWIDNYIRHELTNYDDFENDLRGQVGKNSAYEKELREKMTKEIRKIYPFYEMNSYVDIYRS